MPPKSDAIPFDAGAVSPNLTSPDTQLAARIAERLLAEGLIAAADAPALGGQLAAGELSKAQWRELAEAAAFDVTFDGALGADRPAPDRPRDA